MSSAQKLAAAWVNFYSVEHPRGSDRTQASKRYLDAEVAAFELVDTVRDNPELAWSAIIEVLRITDNDWVIGNLAAGPLEDLLWLHGPSFIDRVENESRQSRRFALAFQGVWQLGDGNAEVWARVRALQEAGAADGGA